MSGGLAGLQLTEDDVTKFLASGTHLGTNNLDFQMETYVHKRRNDGILFSIFGPFDFVSKSSVYHPV